VKNEASSARENSVDRRNSTAIVALPPRSGYVSALRVSLRGTFDEHAHQCDGILVGKSLLVDE
jgi:hypothetical protein